MRIFVRGRMWRTFAVCHISTIVGNSFISKKFYAHQRTIPGDELRKLAGYCLEKAEWINVGVSKRVK